jgi:predicted AlkP superfamily phosphohydrolase/phosphomutase
MVILLVMLLPDQAQAYIGPGAGFAVAGSLWVMLTAMLSGILALFTWPVRFLIRMIRGRKAFARSRIKKCVVLGLDGMDYALTKQYLAEGKLPNLAKLQEQGCFKPLATTLPSMSPVAWSSFQTGVNPGKHNIFDFLTRDKRTYAPTLSSVEIRGPKRTLNLGRYQLPLGKASIRLLRKSIPFWKILGEHGIFSSVLRVPITFPPEKFRGVQLSGMCAPDLRGTQGMFSIYTTVAAREGEHTGGDRFHVTCKSNTVQAALIGSPNPFRKDGTLLTCPFTVTISEAEQAHLTLGKKKYPLKQDRYTDWIRVTFKAAPGIRVQGLCRFLLLSTRPDFTLYVTPINIDPEKPAMPIAHPSVYSTYLAKQQGPFATLGLAEDSWALNENLISDEAFIEQCMQSDREREIMFFDSLKKVTRGLCVCVFDGTDRLQHTFWRDIDPDHPVHRKRPRPAQANVIEDLYQRMDDLVGRTVAKCRHKDTVLMIISDHGFNAFRYGVDLNRWLEENGYLTVITEKRQQQHLTAIDWSKTQAFAVGLGGIYLNIKGREAQGIVDPGQEASDLRNDIASKLKELTDPQRHGQATIKQVYTTQAIYRGPYTAEAPDLLVGFSKGYRASWETAVGQVTEQLIHDNTKAWSGDHCIDPSLVPGVLFCNRSIHSERTRLMDIGPTVLDLFGVSIPKHMDGKALAVETRPKTGGHQ